MNGFENKNDNLHFLYKTLRSDNPKLALQALRELLNYKGNIFVDEKLKSLINHENEMIRAIIYKEYFATKKNNNQTSHTQIYDYLKNTVVNGDTIEVMRLLKDESIHLTFTSPPYYNARDYSLYPSYKAYLEFLSEVFKEIFRITKEGRFLIVNASPIIIPRISRSHSSKRYVIPFDLHPYLVDIGWEFIDDIIWLKPGASVKNRVGGFHQHRKSLAYKPNSVTEYLMVYRKHTDKLIDWNIKQYHNTIVEDSKITGQFESSNVLKILPRYNSSHPAVFPKELCKRIIEYYSFKGDLVFDPFAGSWTVAEVVHDYKRFFFLIEINNIYFNNMKLNNIFKEINANFISFSEFRYLSGQ